MVEGGKLMFGRRKVYLEPGTIIRIENQKLILPEEELEWLDIFFRASDRIRFDAVTLRVGERTWENVAVIISENAIEVAGERLELATTEATTNMVIIPREAMGMGDVKFMGAIGAFLGWKATLFTLISSSFIGGFIGLALVLIGRKDWQSRIPYGPYLALGALLWLLAGREIVNWYLNLIVS
jgi:leader peptidase (prepilin peptidase)/N-methyltransferase